MQEYSFTLSQALSQTVSGLPDQPGVYQYFDAKGKLLYVGKAKSLKKRVRSYFRFTPQFAPNPALSMRILKMLHEAEKLDYIIVGSEEDALILENSLIKQLGPKYNILLRDDKTYPYIYIDESEDFPRFEITRKVVKGKKITYYGPFPSGGRSLLDAIYELYRLVQKKSCLREGKACLFYQIKRCLAPCEGKVSPAEYAAIIEEVKEAIVKRKSLISKIEERMFSLAAQERYEEAARMRDISTAINELTISSTIDLANDTNLDIFAIVNGDERGVVVKLFMRGGKIISSSFSYFRQTHIYDSNEAYKQALLEFYTVDSPFVSGDILTAESFEDSEEIAATLSHRFHKKIEIRTPLRGPKARLVALAVQNANELLKQQAPESYIEQDIAHTLDLGRIPYRIETFDNSHMMGEATVGAMVVRDEGKWDKSSYRRYQLSHGDEYAQMREMLTRRIEDFPENPPPDLWILDGGAANLSLANKLLDEAGVNLDVIAIAKEKLDFKAHRAKGAAKDTIYTQNGIIEFKPADKRLHWIQLQRDEAHRFAIAYHQKKKREADKSIKIMEKKGVGEASLKKLINYFGTFEAIENASFEELSKVVNARVARAILSESI